MDDKVKSDRQRGDNSNAEFITPAQFEPIPAGGIPTARHLKPAVIFLLAAVLVALLALWFLFSARSVDIDILPADANYSVTGGFALKLGQRYLLRSGTYQLQATHPAYAALQQDFIVGTADRQQHTFEMQLLPDKLSISSQPPAATLLIDDVKRGVTPVKDLELAKGNYQLRLQAPRYLPREETLTLAGGANVLEKSYELLPAWAEIAIDSVPGGATLSVDGEPVGKTPLQADIVQGLRKLSLKLPGYKTWESELNVTANKPQQLDTVALQKADALLQLRTTPAEAGVLVDGVYRGQTPLELDLTPGKQATIALFKTGYQKTSRKITLESGEQQNLAVTFKPLLGEIRIATRPADATLSVDGVQQKSANTTLQLAATRHKIRVVKKGFAPYETTVTPKPGFPQQVNISLVTARQAKLTALPRSVTTAAGQELVLLRPGSFTMGASRREPGRRANETLRNIELTRPFYLSTREVTNAEFRQFDAKHSSKRVQEKDLDGDRQPVVNVSWLHAVRYCNWLSERDKLKPVYVIRDNLVVGETAGATGYRLPTEAEWEWAARKTSKGMLKYPWGQRLAPPGKAGNYADDAAAYLVGQTIVGYSDGFAVTAPVGSFAPNAHGLYDMGGNVAEWTHDYYGQVRTQGDGVERDPKGPAEGKYHVIRGSSWRHGSHVELRFSFRDYGAIGRDDLGFRLARDAEG